MRVERALACSCGSIQSPVEALQEADAVFAGKLVAVSELDEEPYVYFHLEFEVSRVWKGGLYSTVILKELWTSCSSQMGLGGEYLVFAYDYHEGDYLADGGFCSPTAPLADYSQETLDAMGPGQPPEPGTTSPRPGEPPPPDPSDAGTGTLAEPQSPDGWAIALLAAAAVALAGLGFVVGRRARDG